MAAGVVLRTDSIHVKAVNVLQRRRNVSVLKPGVLEQLLRAAWQHAHGNNCRNTDAGRLHLNRSYALNWLKLVRDLKPPNQLQHVNVIIIKICLFLVS